MNRAVETRVFENLNKYVPIVDELGQQHPEFSRTIELVKLAVNGLSKYYTLFILDQHRKLINTARLEDDYSRNVTLIGREVKTWAGNPDLTLTGKKTINRLYLVLERCLRDALELYTEAERELWRQGGQIRMSAGDAHGEYERAKAALWKFQYDFHLHQIDPNRGTDRAIIYDQSGFSGPPAPGFVVGGFAPPDWQKPDDDRVRILTHEEQVQLKSLLDRPEVQKLIFSNPRNPAIIVISDDEDDNNDDNGVSESSVPVRRIHPLLRPRNVTPQRNGILKTPRVKPRPDKAKKSVRFGPYRPPPLPTYTDDDGSSRNSSTDRRDPPPRPPPTIPSYTPPPPQRPNPSPIVAVTSPTDESSESGWTSPPTQAEPVTEEAADPQGDQLGLLGPVKPRNKRDTSSSAVSSSSSSSSSSSAPASTRATCGDLLISIHTHSSPSSSPSLPSVGELSPTAPAPPPKEGGGDSSVTCSPSDEGSFTPPGDRAPRTSEERPPAQTEEELRREEVALNARAYLGPRHDEYSLALPTDFGAAIPAPVKDETEDEDDSSGHENSRSSAAAAAEDVPYDHEAYTAHDQLGRVAGASTARDVKATALLHWAGVTGAKRQERLEGRRRLSEILGWAERAGKVPLSPASVREGTGLRRGIFVPLGPPDLPPPWSPRGAMRGTSSGGRHRPAVEDFDPVEYGEAALAGVEQVRPRLDLTLSAFLFNEDALRLFGGLVGEKPRPSDLARMDKILRELEVYNAVCAHRRRLVVEHLRRTKRFPAAVGAQLGDVRAALRAAEDGELAAERRCFEHVASRSRRVMAYAGKRRRREFPGGLGARDRERLEHLSREDEEARGLRAELEEAEEWRGWCAGVAEEWAAGWRPGCVERDMLYVGEEAEADVRRYKLEINQKRAGLGLVPVRRPQDEVYKRQQGHIGLLDALWSLIA